MGCFETNIGDKPSVDDIFHASFIEVAPQLING